MSSKIEIFSRRYLPIAKESKSIMARAPRRHGGPKKTRSLIVDGQSFLISITDGQIDHAGNVPLQITCRAEFGARSVCLIRGLTNRSFWHDYPEVEEMRANAISITPKVACDLIRHALQLGWDPEFSKSNFEIAADDELLKRLRSSNPSDRE